MNARETKARQIVATGNIAVGNGCYTVGSQTGAGRHRVVVDGLFPSCSCEDFELNNRDCKHLMAVRAWLAAKASGTPAETVDPSKLVPRKTYSQDWPKYNLAQTTEKSWFMTLLGDLTSSIPEPERKPGKGRPPVKLADAMFAAVYKVYSGFSARRFACDLEEAAGHGHVANVIHFNSVLKALDNEGAAALLTDLLARSASPLRAVESEWAVDSSGFSGCRYDRWFDEKYGTPRTVGTWVKAHICCGTRTNVIAAAEVLDKDTGDSPQLPGLVATTAKGFRVNEVAADKAYPSNVNFEAVEKAGGTLYAAFRSNTTGGVGGRFEKAFHYFGLHRDDFLAHYHRRSMVETTFSMVKRKFGDAVRAKSDTAMKNEVRAKFVAHNICCVISAIYERGIDPTFLGLDGKPDDRPRDVLRFPGLHIK